MRLNHGTPESNEKNPKRHLFGPPAEPRASTETVSPTPSKTTNLNDDMENVNRATSSYSPSVGRTTRRKLAMQTESIPSKQFENTPLSLHGSVNPAVRPSLVVKLKIRKPSGTMNVETRRKHKSPSSDAITKDDTAMKEGAVSQGTSYVRTYELRREIRSTTLITRPWQGDSAADGAHNDTPESPQPRRNSVTRPRRGAIAYPVKLPEARLRTPTSESKDDIFSGPPETLSKPGPSLPETKIPVLEASTPLQVTSASTFAPYPPMSPRSVSPFIRGAQIALENLLLDHHSDPLASLIDLVEELDDTRPIVNDWEHVTVMKGGSWIYQVMRDVWEEAASETDDEDEEIDVECILVKVAEWVEREMERLRGSEQV
ncbi:hypothetical protein AA0119_g2408 [Alternaria tenuissima]|uniref:DUF4378 domain-containing protein n=1 Tax=Alternaria tenuissima TaxID=119927 RepID=A0ABY0GJQ2_9PLEO|nr:hypothetical protein AA0119_g2408 [Alternaria tenuissima]RYO18906.1 hypothetical protein AA0121_g4597 [Alternaria tenuissima]RYO68143.1 hypothetical protein AA0116_g1262 [Alternaria tenuissima]